MQTLSRNNLLVLQPDTQTQVLTSSQNAMDQTPRIVNNYLSPLLNMERASASTETSVSVVGDDNETSISTTSNARSPGCSIDYSRSFSLLYPDTAPRAAWRPQLDAWMKKNHPSKLKEIAQMAKECEIELLEKERTDRKLDRNAKESAKQSVPNTIYKSKSSTGRKILNATREPTAKYSSHVDNRYGSHNEDKRQQQQQQQHHHQHQQQYNSQIQQHPVEYSDFKTYSIDTHSNHSYTTVAIPNTNSYSELQPHGGHSPTLHNSKRPHDTKPYARPSERSYTTSTMDDQDEQLDLSRAVDLPSPPESPSYSTSSTSIGSASGIQQRRRCISCGSDQSPCWRPSWSSTAGQLCNSCGLRYKKTGARCINSQCGRIPAKGEWATMKNRAVKDSQGKVIYSCLNCGGQVGVGER